MSNVQFSDDKVVSLIKPLTTGKEEHSFLTAEKFWKKFGLSNDMSELQAQANQALATVGVTAAFEVTLSLLNDDAAGEDEQEALEDGARSASPVSPNFTADQLAAVADAVAEEVDQMLFLTSDEFWTHFGLTNTMQALEHEAAEKFDAVGVLVSFDVVLTFIAAELPLSMAFDGPARPAPLDLNADTVRALSIRQPWVELILRGEKNLEYRSRRMKEMGPLLIHASRTLDEENISQHGFTSENLPFGALVGIVDVVGCIEVDGEAGLYAYQLAHPRRFRRPIPYAGAAGIFRVPVSEVRAALIEGVDLPHQS